jgi:hypothetical protein
MHPYLRFELLLRPAPGAGPDSDGGAIPSPLVRRVLGKALVERFCPFGQPLCESRPAAGSAERSAAGGGERPPAPRDLCYLAEVCPYGILFAASLTGRPPYAVHVPPGGGGSEGPARIEVTLYGPAWQLYSWALTALQRAFRDGLGKSRQGWEIEVVFRTRLEGGRERLAGGDLSHLPPTLRPDLLGLGLEPYLAVREVAIDLLSPARLLRDGRLLGGAERLPFDLLIARILDRFASLYGDGASDILRPEIRSVVESEAAAVPLLTDETRWHEVRDYSSRSRSELLLGGKVGRLVYGPQAARFLPILRAGEILHLGKNAASGCGRLQVTLAAAELPVPSPDAGQRTARVVGPGRPGGRTVSEGSEARPEHAETADRG